MQLHLYGTLFMLAAPTRRSATARARDFIYRRGRPAPGQMGFVLYFLFFFPGMLAFVYAGYATPRCLG